MPMGRTPTKHFNLPKGMRARPKAKGKIYYYYDTGGKPRKEIPLGSDYVIAVKKWAELSIAQVPANALPTIAHVWDKFLHEELTLKSQSTQDDYIKCWKQLSAFFCNPTPAPLEDIDPILIRSYMDLRKESPVRANHEARLFNLLFNRAREWGLTNKENPCTGVRRYKETGRNIYIDDKIYNIVYECADQPTKDALDLAYLTSQRPGDVIKMSEMHIQDGMLEIQQNKTGKKIKIRITGQLKELIERIKLRKQAHKVFSLALIVDERGRSLTQRAIYDRFTTARQKAVEQNPKLSEEIKQYQIRDLRAKGVTDKYDTEGIEQAKAIAGHSTESMTHHYVRKINGTIVDPTK